MNKEIIKINNLGQSIWIDSISRGMIKNGKIESMVNNGVSGITSNPAIFQKALSNEKTYDEDIKKLVMSGLNDPKKIFQELSIKEAGKYAAEDADMTLRLWKRFKSFMVKDKQVKIYEIIEKPLAQVIMNMEKHGISIDVNKLNELSVGPTSSGTNVA